MINVNAVYDALATVQSKPGNLAKALDYVQPTGDVAVTVDDLADCFRDSVDEVIEACRRCLAALDVASRSNTWTADTAPNSIERRERIYCVMGVSGRLQSEFDEKCPFLPIRNEADDSTIVIPGRDTEWYTDTRKKEHNFYWSQYRKYLARRGFEPVAIQQVDDDTNDIVSFLDDPRAWTPNPSRGLVVGYVQSGKTTNFTALIAKSIDAGYRLIIVLAGTLNVLRNQTQRRLDMELVGKENIDFFSGSDVHDYSTDSGWKERFVEYGALPDTLGGSNIIRLTDYSGDFRALHLGLNALHFERIKPRLPLFNPENLYHASTRLIVCKKNSSVLKKLTKDLKRVKDIAEVPTLIIDDESDQASINTSRPKEEDVVKRTAINRQIVELLGLLKRAQYVGYTATPVANVFINPDDPEDLFPKDFVISLKQPAAYFGASTFHDIDDEPDSEDIKPSNPLGFVRDIITEIGKDDYELRQALDLFVLTGAIKLYRQELRVSGEFTHHTMLIHMSHLQSEHMALRDRVGKLWDTSQYVTGGAYPRLAALFDSDIRRVTEAREPTLPLPSGFAELQPFVQAALNKITADGPVRMINGHEDADCLDFDRGSVWKIIVGGTKLSRGYTIEGLTISYFRRTIKAQDSLLQMGRWFGYRPGYRDLPRLFIGRKEIISKSKTAATLDLLEAFKGICRTERSFRQSLARYAIKRPGEPRVTPMDIPPIVEVNFLDLPVVAKNRMWNAELISENWSRRWIQPTFFSAENSVNVRNFELLTSLVSRSESRFATATFDVPGGPSFPALAGLVTHANMSDFITKFDFSEKDHRFFRAQRGFICGQHGEHGMEDWLVIFPLLSSQANRFVSLITAAPAVSVIERTRTGASKRINALAGSNHRAAAEAINDPAIPPTQLSGAAAAFHSPTRGVALCFLVVDKANPSEEVTPAFELFPAMNTLPDAPRLRVRREGLPYVIDLPPAPNVR